MVKYHKCPGCSTIFTDQDISSHIITENDSPELRNTTSLFKMRVSRVGSLKGQILDFGCGHGAFVTYLNSLPDTRAIGVDKNTIVKLEHFTDGIFDGAFMVEVIEHLPTPLDTINTILSKLKPNGFLYIESTFADSILNHANHSYVDATIGHVTMLSKFALTQIPATQIWLNNNTLLLRK